MPPKQGAGPGEGKQLRRTVRAIPGVAEEWDLAPCAGSWVGIGSLRLEGLAPSAPSNARSKAQQIRPAALRQPAYKSLSPTKPSGPRRCTARPAPNPDRSYHPMHQKWLVRAPTTDVPHN